MKRHSLLATLLALVASLVLSGQVLAVDPVVNGSFEEDSAVNIGSFKQVNAGSTEITGWTVGAAVDWIGTYWPEPWGSRSIDMNASPSMGRLSQDFTTAVNNHYTVTWKMSGNPNCGAGPKTMDVSATGGPVTEFTYTVPAGANNGNMEWVDRQYDFVGAGSSTTLTFQSTTTGNCGPAIDKVVVTETVATAEQCKKGGWESMTDNLGTPFKNQGDCVSYYATGERNLAAGS
jgi:choice-of-anchor C domain-containing protein